MEPCGGGLVSGLDEISSVFPYRVLASYPVLLVLLDAANSCQVSIDVVDTNMSLTPSHQGRLLGWAFVMIGRMMRMRETIKFFQRKSESTFGRCVAFHKGLAFLKDWVQD
jgi:hypothetical protein